MNNKIVFEKEYSINSSPFTINTNFEITNEHIPLKPFVSYLKKR